jgi:carbamoyltransferase
MIVLGIKPYGHDTSGAIVVDGKIVAAASEERFDREKHSRNFPLNAINYCLDVAKIKDINKIDEISIGFDYLKLAFFLDFIGFFRYFPVYTKESFINGKYQLQKIVKTKRILRRKYGYRGKIKFLDHHDCHAASCFFPSGFHNATVMTLDGRGELTSTRIYKATGNSFKKVFQLNYPNSLGAFYSCITEYLGFRDNCDEGKVMGLAPYGDLSLVSKMRKVLIVDGNGYQLNFDFFDFHRYPDRNVSSRFIDLFGLPRAKGKKINQRYKNIARATQVVLEEAVLRLAKRAKDLTKEDNLCLSGGVALNSVANGKIVESGLFKNVYIYPAAGDDGVSVGAALASYYACTNSSERPAGNQSPYLGCDYSGTEILKVLRKSELKFSNPKNLYIQAASLLVEGKCIGWFQGRFEFGPRALGNRSILIDPRKAENKDLVNSKIKFREPFRPFAPSVMGERPLRFPKFVEVQHCMQIRMILRAFQINLITYWLIS